MTENIEYADTDLTPLMEGDNNFRYDEGYEDAGYIERNLEEETNLDFSSFDSDDSYNLPDDEFEE